MSKESKQVIFQETPIGLPQKDKTLVVKSTSVSIEPPANGFVLKTLVVSVDPYMRGRLRDADAKSYSPPFEKGKPLSGGGVSVVIASNTDDYPKDTLVSTIMTPHSEYWTLTAEDAKKIGVVKVDNKYNLPIEHFVGVLGMPGFTAYSSLYEIGEPKKGETIFISSASGAVGSLVGQLAKREGLRVIGSAGSDEKIKYLKEVLKFDEAFNYKTEKPHDALPKYAPEGIDIYYDNVGGDTLEAAIQNTKNFARIIACGMISQYNNKSAEESYGIKNLMLFVSRRLKMQGFIQIDFKQKWEKEFKENMPKWLHEGAITYKEDVTNGIDGEIDGFIGMLQGTNFGKAVIKYADN